MKKQPFYPRFLQESSQRVTRREFTARMAKVKYLMTQKEVRALLGPPDVVLDQFWFYGVSGKSVCPTLGSVSFDDANKVASTVGGSGEPPPESLISEVRLRELLEFLWSLSPRYLPHWRGESLRCSLARGYLFDPLTCIRAVNTLRKLGKELVLAVANEYFRVCVDMDDDDDVMIVLRLLFETPDNRSFSLWCTGIATYPPTPANKALVPLFPLVLWEDVPLFLVYETPQRRYVHKFPSPPFLEVLKKEGRLRKAPLRPPSDPLGILDRVSASDQWLFGKNYPASDLRYGHDQDETWEGRMNGMLQLLRLVHSVLQASSHYWAYLKILLPNTNPVGVQWEPALRPYRDPKEWQRLRTELTRRALRWDPERNEYRVV